MKRIFKKSELCNNVLQHLNCDKQTVENTIIGLLSQEYPPDTGYDFNYLDDDTIEVQIDTTQE